MLSVGCCQASVHFLPNSPTKLSLVVPDSNPKCQSPVRFNRPRLRPGTKLNKCDRRQLRSPIVAMAAPPATIQTANPSDAPSTSETRGEVVVVGAGPAGCLLAHYLLRRGFSVHLFEKRPGAPPLQSEGNGSDQQVYVRGDSRSFTILLTSRAMKAFDGAGLELPPNLLKQVVGSCSHLPNGKKRMFNYPNEPGLLSFGVSRNALVAWLQQSLHERYSNLKTYFEYELESVDTTANTASFRLCSKDFFSQKPEVVNVKYDLLVGADGVNSAVRSEMIKSDSSGSSSSEKKSGPLTLDYQPIEESYKSFHVKPELAMKSSLYKDNNRIHLWHAVSVLVTGMIDGSFWGFAPRARSFWRHPLHARWKFSSGKMHQKCLSCSLRRTPIFAKISSGSRQYCPVGLSSSHGFTMGTASSLVMLHTPCFHHMARDATLHLKIVCSWIKFLAKPFTEMELKSISRK